MLTTEKIQHHGISDISLPTTQRFLALHDLSQVPAAETDLQKVLREIFIHFDLLTSCNLRDFLRAKTFFTSLKMQNLQNPVFKHIIGALYYWSELNYSRARSLFAQHVNQYPGDVAALFMLHMLDFCCGQTSELLPLTQKLDTAIPADYPLYGYYLAIKSFVMGEAGHYQAALEIGLEACSLIQDNIYGVHAVAHAYHETNRHEQVLQFLHTTQPIWISNAGMQMHVCWHVALAELSLFSIDKAKTAFHRFYAMKTAPDKEQDLDAVGFLWRYKLCFPDDRQYDENWTQLADNWTGCVGASTSYFHDVHAAFAFTAVNKPLLIRKLIARSDGTGIPEGAHTIGLDILRAIYHYSIGQYYDCARLLVSTKPNWSKIGGSNAQRDLLRLTLQDAICRDPLCLQEFANERQLLEQKSPLMAFVSENAPQISSQ
jgi:tetratricopeptide (TPR) repeat protein